ncbi:hypothetical protein AYO43_01115 [Nitrospira sp. SCGC AG-212-E16]|nr:hypothetical protein AYO43_01115 [Nitrospira sp. SCGC AG-212-E16]
MTLLARWALISLGVVGAISAAASLQAASNRPFWTEQAMFRFGEDMFFTGRATCVASAEDGRQRAYNAALQEILNYTRTKEVVGIPIETQMIYEEDDSDSCRSGHVSVWRLLRAPASRLDKLNRMASLQASSQDLQTVRSGVSGKVRDLTPKIGTYKDDAFELFGQPKSVSMVEHATEVHWEYPRFGFMLIFDANGYLIRWRQVGPKSSQLGDGSDEHRKSEFVGLEGSIDPSKKKKVKEEAIDLSTRLEKMQLESKDREKETDAVRHCERVYPRDRQLQNSCIQYETDKRKHLSLSGGDVRSDADRAAKVMCTNRWPTNLTLQDSCQKFERERILSSQQRRY